MQKATKITSDTNKTATSDFEAEELKKQEAIKGTVDTAIEASYISKEAVSDFSSGVSSSISSIAPKMESALKPIAGAVNRIFNDIPQQAIEKMAGVANSLLSTAESAINAVAPNMGGKGVYSASGMGSMGTININAGKDSIPVYGDGKTLDKINLALRRQGLVTA